MRSKKLCLIMLTVMLVMGIFATSISAANAFYTCYVKGVGMGFGKVYIKLEDAAASPAFSAQYHIAAEGQENKILAVAMTAQVNGYKVLVYTDPTLDQNDRVIYAIYTAD